MAVRLIVVDDHKLIRDGLKSLISRYSEYELVGEAGDGRSAINLVRETRPDIVIMDVSMPGMNGYDATHQILSELPDTKIIALSMHSDRRFVIQMLKAGAHGYMLKDCAFEEIVRAMSAVLSGQTYLSPGIAGVVVEDCITKNTSPGQSTLSVLSNREREVLQLMAEGYSTKEIASRISLSVKTVETHRKKIMDKLSIRSVASLTKFAIREGLTTLDS